VADESTSNDLSGTVHGDAYQIGRAGQVNFNQWDASILRELLWQVPSVAPAFINRTRELGSMTALLDRPGQDGQEAPGAQDAAFTPSIIVLSGPPGIGKSALGCRFAASTLERFPDGQFYVRLPAYRTSGGAVDLAEVYRALLRTLGVAEQVMPKAAEDLGRMYRSLMHGRKALVIVEDAELAAHATALTPGQDGTLLVTSRRRLAELRGARTVSLPLEPLAVDEAVELIGRKIGADRVAAEPEEARGLAELCSRLPVLLSAIGASLVERPHRTLAETVASLKIGATRNARFEESGAFAVLDESYAQLKPSAAQIYRVLALMPGTHTTSLALAAALGTSAEHLDDALDELVVANLVEGLSGGRYVPHSMIRVHAAYVAGQVFTAEERAEIERRVVGWYLACGQAADRAVAPNRLRLPGTPETGSPIAAPVFSFSTDSKALAWLELEHTALLDCLRMAVEHQWDETAWLFCDPLWVLYQHHKHFAAWTKAFASGIEAAERAGNGWVCARLRCLLSRAYIEMGEFAEADACLVPALELARIEGDLMLEASVLEFMGVSCVNSGRFERALDFFAQGRERLTLAAETPDRRRADLLLRYLSGRAHVGLGDFDAAFAILQPAYDEASGRPEDARTAGRIRLWLSEALIGQRAAVRAIPLAALALQEAERRDVPIERRDALLLLATCHDALGEVELAAQRRAEAAEIQARLEGRAD
jgi:tetratricopeptide (TPR) repeat protein